MAYTEIVGNLNYLTIYKEIMKASTGQDSAYIRAKETLTAVLSDNGLTAEAKGTILSQTISGIASNITTQALNAAIQIAKENRDAPYMLAKLRADTELTQANKLKLEVDKVVSTATAAKIEADTKATIIGSWKVQADIYSKNGLNTDTQSITNPILGISLLAKNPLGTDVVSAEQGKAATYSTLASSAKRDGNVTITRDPISGHVSSLTPTTPNNQILAGAQIDVAVRQEKAFDDNKVQHAANSSSTMIGMLLSTENTASLTTADVDLWRSAVTELNTPTT